MKSLTKTNNDFWEDMDAQDFKTPKVTIGMGSPIKGKVGHFNFSTGESLSELVGVSLLARSYGYVLYAGIGQVPPRCASKDGRNPDDKIANPITDELNGGCDACFANKWGQDARKDALQTSLGLSPSGQKPTCQQTVSLLLTDSSGMPFVLIAKTHNVRVIKNQLLTNLRIRSIALNSPHYAVGFNLTLIPIKGMGNRFEIFVGGWKKLTAEEIEVRANLYRMLGPRAPDHSDAPPPDTASLDSSEKRDAQTN